MIVYTEYDVEIPSFPRRITKNWIKQIAANYNKRIGDIAYIFCSDKIILNLNIQYLNHNYTTDILTFDYSDQNRLSGDLFISVDTVSANAKQFHTDYETELYRVMIHGILHLCGMEDKTSKQRQQMRKCENEALEKFFYYKKYTELCKKNICDSNMML